ncbi:MULTISPECIES: universal stress protein [Paenarthrobacter]|uniref:universal stress protein n=1 Tax=Paenarthrobacter TaxID=1742992 RepID=UPI00236725D4|nr:MULTISPECIES: universal stress protein [Paenarthrobacter]MDD7833828.1 universal stress protein [Paenarthrobacter sp. AB444]MDP9933871.1 nucleotide-binding universal stress UspA family protein [Paenarthrobacter nicotinovorans]
MSSPVHPGRIIVGVDGSAASKDALREGQRLAVALNAPLEAWGCWELPIGYEGYLSMGIDGFAHGAEENIKEALRDVFGPEPPKNVSTRLVQGSARATLVEGSKHASLLVVGRRGHGGFRGLLLGSVSSAVVAHSHCPVVVVHTQQVPSRNESNP